MCEQISFALCRSDQAARVLVECLQRRIQIGTPNANRKYRETGSAVPNHRRFTHRIADMRPRVRKGQLRGVVRYPGNGTGVIHSNISAVVRMIPMRWNRPPIRSPEVPLPGARSPCYGRESRHRACNSKPIDGHAAMIAFLAAEESSGVSAEAIRVALGSAQ
jgi:hypothetical protein